MKRKQPSQRDRDLPCAEYSHDDGIDPRKFFRPERTSKKSNRKVLQLCGQVAETLNQVLAGECGDEVLAELQVASVVPAPDATQLLVIIEPLFVPGPEEQLVNARFSAAAGRLRAEVAAAITRRRAPKLLFQYLPRTANTQGGHG